MKSVYTLWYGKNVALDANAIKALVEEKNPDTNAGQEQVLYKTIMDSKEKPMILNWLLRMTRCTKTQKDTKTAAVAGRKDWIYWVKYIEIMYTTKWKHLVKIQA